MKKGSNADEVITHLRARGIKDPLVECHTHGTKLRLSQLTDISQLCLEEGLDSPADEPCLLERRSAR